tara:strand:- start:5495 stop:6532 length:1038 start_codon:yes stop_codon:yes gene_type:complete
MANIALRNPQYKNIVASASGSATPLSVSCKITIDGTLRYTLIKNAPVLNSNVQFDIAELVRDYLNITYQSSYAIQTVAIITVLSTHQLINGTGTVYDTTGNITDTGFEAYGTFDEGANPSVPFISVQSAEFLIAPNFSGNPDGTTPPKWQIYYPTGKEGYVSYISQSGITAVYNFNGNATSQAGQGSLICVIKRIDCTKYGVGTKIIFINKYGVQQDLWFFLKETKQVNRTNENYKSNTIVYPTLGKAFYDIKNAPNKLFNTQAKQTLSLSSGYYPEQANEMFQQLLMSEYVWLERPKNSNPSTNEIVPVIVKSSNIDFKTSVNDRLIEYTIEFENAFDYINNIR